VLSFRPARSAQFSPGADNRSSASRARSRARLHASGLLLDGHGVQDLPPCPDHGLQGSTAQLGNHDRGGEHGNHGQPRVDWISCSPPRAEPREPGKATSGRSASGVAMRLKDADARRLAAAADHAVLATVDPQGRPHAVPACFVIDGDVVAIPIDEVKPKASFELQRARNLERDPRAALLCEHWDARDWSRLWWVRLDLVRSREAGNLEAHLAAALRARYPQYATTTFAAVLTFRIERIIGWAARAPMVRPSAPPV
jgi:PPOX class probable F420-dependent enzyme